jgi:hypothetical protein
MPSLALQRWNSTAQQQLDQIEATHIVIGGPAPGRRYTTQHINQAYTTLLSAHFQRFCRDLHSEAVDYLCEQTPGQAPDGRRSVLRLVLTQGRKLDSGNPNPGNIGSDFARFNSMALWPLVDARNPKNSRLKVELETLNEWRNAIAHQDFHPQKLNGRISVRLSDVRAWRSSCRKLAHEFDAVVGQQLAIILGVPAW